MHAPILNPHFLLRHIFFQTTLSFFITFGCSAGWCAFGESGGVRNESDVPLRLKIESENGDYEWQRLSPGVSVDFYERTAGASFHVHPEHPISPRTRIRILVNHPDGTLETIDKLEHFILLRRR